MSIEANISNASGIHLQESDIQKVMHKILENAPINRAEFIAYMAACAHDYWNEALEHEDNPPEQLGGAERLEDFSIYFKENCAS